jgi:Raf kinase inhibitor-like YbhB/YbcL family protein
MKAKLVGLFFMSGILVAFAGGGAKMKITSSAFPEGGNIPQKFSCDGSDVNPPLHFDGAPAGVKSLALVVEDPDAPSGLFTHWLVWNFDAKTTNIPENNVPHQAGEGTNDFGKTGYGGPCPPSGTHRYYFKIFALDQPLDLKPGAKRKEVDAAIRGHVIGQGELMGRYSRKK